MTDEKSTNRVFATDFTFYLKYYLYLYLNNYFIVMFLVFLTLRKTVLQFYLHKDNQHLNIV